MKDKTYIFHTDAGHGWIAVKKKEVKELGLMGKITPCSYQKGETAYLEEDHDACLFIEAKDKKGEKVLTRVSFQEYSPIRSYEPFLQEIT